MSIARSHPTGTFSLRSMKDQKISCPVFLPDTVRMCISCEAMVPGTTLIVGGSRSHFGGSLRGKDLPALAFWSGHSSATVYVALTLDSTAVLESI